MSAYPLFFIRHGETFYNAEGRIQGRLDTPLSPRGRDQAASVGRNLRHALRARAIDPASIRYFASPLSRAVETMSVARKAMALPPDDFLRDDRLVELCFGTWQNLTWAEIRARDPQGVAMREKNVWDIPPPQGESYAALVLRVKPWLAELNGPCVVVSHGGVARALMTLRGGIDPADAPTMPVYQGRILAFENDRGRWI